MASINNITNANKLVEKKVNFFLDVLQHIVAYIGIEPHLEMESPISVVEKVLFRLTEDNEYRLEYLDSYFIDSFFTSGTLWDNYPNYSEVKKIVSAYNLLGRKKRQEKITLIDSNIFQNHLKQLLRELKHKMHENLVDAVLTMIVCKHDLQDKIPDSSDTHEEAFKSYALVLASEYFFQGHTRSEIRGIVSDVFSKNIDIFPFPLHIKTKRERKAHLAEKELKNQLHGFTNAFKLQPNHETIMVKVFGGNFPEDFEFRYNKVKFWGKGHSFFEKVKEEVKKDIFNDFFDGRDYILASAQIHWYSQATLLNRITNVVRQELVFLSASLNRDFSVDTTQNYLRFNHKMNFKGSAWSTQKHDNPFTSEDLDKLSDNGYHALRRHRGEAIDWFLSCESIFVNAHKNDSVEDYWLYLETLLSFNKKNKEVKGIVSSIILNNEKFIRDRRILSTLRDCFGLFNRGINLLKVDNERWKKIMKSFQNGRIPKEILQIDYPFIQLLIKEYKQKLDTDYYKKSKEYYYRMLTEAYEYRNAVVHKGVVNDKSRTKLLSTIPNMIFRLRWIVIKELRIDSNNLPFDLLIEHLSKRGDKLL